MGWVGSAMGYYRLLGDVSTPISTNYPLTVYTEYTGIVIQTRTCRAVGYWSSLAPEYRVLPTSPSPAVTRPYTSLLVLPRPESHPVPSRPVPSHGSIFCTDARVARSEPGWCAISTESVDSTGDVALGLRPYARSKCNKFFEFISYIEREKRKREREKGRRLRISDYFHDSCFYIFFIKIFIDNNL